MSLLIQPNQPLTWANLGWVREAEGDVDGARVAFEASLRLDPTDESVHHDYRELWPDP